MLGGLALPGRAAGEPYRTVPQKPNCRVIVDNDFAGDPDGLVALAHQLLSPKSAVPLVTCTPLPDAFRGAVPAGITTERGVQIARALIRQAAVPGRDSVPVVAGPERFDALAADRAEAARAIVAEAMRADPLPLFLTCGGPLTNVAAALRLEPAIAKRMTVIWIGGGDYPHGGWEYNLATDLDAARHVIEKTRVPLWQVPQGTYRQMQVSVAELRVRLRAASPLGRWLYETFTSPPDFVDIGGAWPMGDSPPVLFTAVSQGSSRFVTQPARRTLPDRTYGAPLKDRELRICQSVDVRLAMEDFFAKLQSGA
ncbi:nucleoside hydrolase (plasmid) [Novosphingobium resinovorum]|uniref:nucleoside hydrolase n=1 Tax=Novosphingobium TaxID=165696 RepID=UPI001B3CA0B9|nr:MULTISPECIES: nucleoside hydrolase [Novosphingobium]MBF7015687.1 nucleoside hydrolase [Novosphingobium sp. HR1a]WJM29679.1 nucleoside hydrolase [Novosphingobium resinovorum]